MREPEGELFRWADGQTPNSFVVFTAGPYLLFRVGHAGTGVVVRLDRRVIVGLASTLSGWLEDTEPIAVSEAALRRVIPGASEASYRRAATAVILALQAAELIKPEGESPST